MRRGQKKTTISTAYQISDNIFILYSGSTAESGNIEKIINSPQHPYTQALLASIPIPDPDFRWSEDIQSRATDRTVTDTVDGCKFADRCEFVMDVCLKRTPPPFAVEHDHFAACHLYGDDRALP